MPTELTIEAAMIELNRLKTTERMDIDHERLTAAIDVLKDAARFRIAKNPLRVRQPKDLFGRKVEYRFNCANCNTMLNLHWKFCPECGQALDWSSL